MRISDWSSDVCSSDLQQLEPPADVVEVEDMLAAGIGGAVHLVALVEQRRAVDRRVVLQIGVLADRHFRELQLLHRRGVRHGAERVLELSAKFGRSEEHTSELQSLMRISYAVFCLQKKNTFNR